MYRYEIPLYSYNSSATCTELKPFVLFLALCSPDVEKSVKNFSHNNIFKENVEIRIFAFLNFILVFCGIVSCFTCEDDSYIDCKNRLAYGGCEVKGSCLMWTMNNYDLCRG